MTEGGVYNAAELSKLATDLSSIEDWLADHCTARHAGDMADVVHKAWEVVEDLYDHQAEVEAEAMKRLVPEGEWPAVSVRTVPSAVDVATAEGLLGGHPGPAEMGSPGGAGPGQQK